MNNNLYMKIYLKNMKLNKVITGIIMKNKKILNNFRKIFRIKFRNMS